MRVLSITQLYSVFGKSSNILTSNIIYRIQIHNIAVELSTGTGIFGTGVFGVTVRDLDGNDVPECPSKLLYSREEADWYIKDLRVHQLLESNQGNHND